MKIIIVYNSKTGFTKKYAEWIKEELKCDSISFEERKQVNFAQYDMILYGGGIYAGMINGIKWYKEMLKEWKGKEKMVFITGAAPADSNNIDTTIQQNFTQGELAQIKVYYLQSGLNYEKMGWKDKIMMTVFRKMLKKKTNQTEEEKQMASMVQSSFDYSDRKFIMPLIEYIKEQKKVRKEVQNIKTD